MGRFWFGHKKLYVDISIEMTFFVHEIAGDYLESMLYKHDIGFNTAQEWAVTIVYVLSYIKLILRRSLPHYAGW